MFKQIRIECLIIHHWLTFQFIAKGLHCSLWLSHCLLGWRRTDRVSSCWVCRDFWRSGGCHACWLIWWTRMPCDAVIGFVRSLTCWSLLLFCGLTCLRRCFDWPSRRHRIGKSHTVCDSFEISDASSGSAQPKTSSFDKAHQVLWSD